MKTFWDKIACLYDLAEFTNKSVNDQMAKAVENEIPQGALVLDCAAGTGALSMAAAKKAKHVTLHRYVKGNAHRIYEKSPSAGNIQYQLCKA